MATAGSGGTAMSAGDLGPVLRLERIRDRLPDHRVHVELRSPRWWADEDDRRRTLDLLRAFGLVHVVVDAPVKSGLPAAVDATADAAVVRFHGRNDENWDKRGITAAERFDYLYDEAELAEWVPRIPDLASRVDKVHVLMNNCYGDKGVRNAEGLSRLLGAGGLGG